MPIQKQGQAKYPIPDATEMIPTVKNAPIVVVADTETTGFGAWDDITEIGAVKIDVETGAILEKFSTFVHLKMQKKVPLKITEVTGITTGMLEDAPPVELVLQKFLEFVSDCPIVFHNASFDWRMLNTKFATIGHTLRNPVICTLKLFKHLHPSLPGGLKEVTAYYGTPIEGHHRAYVDCKWTAACYRKIRGELLQMETEQIGLHTKTEAPSQEQCQQAMQSSVIYRVSGWKKKGHDRIYVTTSIANVFYDIDFGVWNVADRKEPIDIDLTAYSQLILSRLGLTLDEFICRYRG